ncbi:c-type cytochrome [Flavitalea flava]
MPRVLAAVLLIVLAIILETRPGSFIGKRKTISRDSPGTTGESVWIAPDSHQLSYRPEAELIRNGRTLIAGTSLYFGPKGRINHHANGMNCQNCHLEAGALPWGDNFGAVCSTYPRFRERRDAIESIFQRVNDCFERSLNGQALDSGSHEMQAIIAYIKWLGEKIPRGTQLKGCGIRSLKFLGRAADVTQGESVYLNKCMSCHGPEGEGKTDSTGSFFLYPPLWGRNSYNTAAGLYRLSRFAGFVKDNMPLGASYQNPLLTDEEAWDVAAFVNSRPRPDKKFSQDWPDRSLKPVDLPFGPYTDSFSTRQHKFGPFGPIEKDRETLPGMLTQKP